MASKKLKKFLIAGAAAAALGAARNKSLLAATEDGKGGIDTIQKAKQAMTSDAAMKGGKGYKDSIMRSGAGTKAGSIGMGQKIKNFLTKEVINIPKTPGSENFGLGDMDGAKKGKFFELEGDYKGKSIPGMAEELIKTAANQHVRAGKKIVKAVKNQKGKNKNFGLESMDGARYGKMINANHGVMVEARGNKLARSKPTKIF
jgi:hypothetical protein